LEDVNAFFEEVVALQEPPDKELQRELVANFIQLPLESLRNRDLYEHARRQVGLRYNHLRAYSLAHVAFRMTIELVFYLDLETMANVRHCWLAQRKGPVKSMTFSDLKTLGENLDAVVSFARIDMHHIHIGARGIRYER
jgi:hypothetical protein